VTEINDPSLKLVRSACLITLAALIVGCSSGPSSIVIQDKKYEYRRVVQIDPLEVPPDLTSSGIDERMAVPDIAPRDTATFSDYTRERSGVSGDVVLADIEGVQVERAGDKRWLLINAEPARVWDAMRRFWKQSGFTVKREDAALGILETEWHENAAAVPASGFRRMMTAIAGPLHTIPVRDRFRVRLESVAGGNTELFLTHQGIIEEEGSLGSPVWRHRPNDPELEAEMLYRLMTFWGVDQGIARAQVDEAAPQAEKATLTTTENSTSLLVEDAFARAWRRVGVALDRIGFAVEDRDRSRGTYLVRYHDPDADSGSEGVLAKLAFWKASGDEESALYNVKLKDDGDRTRIAVGDESGMLVNNSTTRRILELLYEELR